MNSRFVDSNLFLLEIQNKLYLFIHYIDNIYYFHHFFYFCEPSHIYIQLQIIIHISYNFLYIYRKSKCKIVILLAIAGPYLMATGGKSGDLVLSPADLDLTVWLLIAVIVVVGTAGGFSLFLQGVRYIGPAKGTLIGCLEPISATILSLLFLNTRFSAVELIGFSAILTTVVLSMGEGKNEKDHQDHKLRWSFCVLYHSATQSCGAALENW